MPIPPPNVTPIDEKGTRTLPWYNYFNDLTNSLATLTTDVAGLDPLETGTFAAAATQPIVLTDYAAYRTIRIVLTDVTLSVPGEECAVRFSTDGGSTYDSGGSDYSWGFTQTSAAASAPSPWTDGGGSTADSSIRLELFGSTTAGLSGSAEIDILNRTAGRTMLRASCMSHYSDDNWYANLCFGERIAQQDTDAIQIFPVSGTFSGSYAVYGIK